MVKRLSFVVIIVLITSSLGYGQNAHMTEKNLHIRQIRSESGIDFHKLNKIQDLSNIDYQEYDANTESYDETTPTVGTNADIGLSDEKSSSENKTEIQEVDHEMEYSNELLNDVEYNTDFDGNIDDTGKTMTAGEPLLVETSTMTTKKYLNHRTNTQNDSKEWSTESISLEHRIDNEKSSNESKFLNHKMDSDSPLKKDRENYSSNRFVIMPLDILNAEKIQSNGSFSLPSNLDTYLPKTNVVINNTFKTISNDERTEEKDISDEMNILDEKEERSENSDIVIPDNLETLIPSEMINLNEELKDKDSHENPVNDEMEIHEDHDSYVNEKRKERRIKFDHKVKENFKFSDHVGNPKEYTIKPVSVLDHVNISNQVLSLLKNRIPRKDRGVFSKVKNANEFQNKKVQQVDPKSQYKNTMESKEHKTLLVPLNALQNLAGATHAMNDLIETIDNSKYAEESTTENSNKYTPNTVTYQKNNHAINYDEVTVIPSEGIPNNNTIKDTVTFLIVDPQNVNDENLKSATLDVEIKSKSSSNLQSTTEYDNSNETKPVPPLTTLPPTIGTKVKIPVTEYFTEIPGLAPIIAYQESKDFKNHKIRRGKLLFSNSDDPIIPFNYSKEQYEAIKAVNLDKIVDLIMNKNITSPEHTPDRYKVNIEEKSTLENAVSSFNNPNDKSKAQTVPSKEHQSKKEFDTIGALTTALPTIATTTPAAIVTTALPTLKTTTTTVKTPVPTLKTTKTPTTVKTVLTNDEFKMNLIRNIIRDKVRSKMRIYENIEDKPAPEQPLETTTGENNKIVETFRHWRRKRNVGEHLHENSFNDWHSNSIDTGSNEEFITEKDELTKNKFIEFIDSHIGNQTAMLNGTQHNPNINIESSNQNASKGATSHLQKYAQKVPTVFEFLTDLFYVVRVLTSRCVDTIDDSLDNSTKCLRRIISRTLQRAVESDEILIGYNLVLVKTPTG